MKSLATRPALIALVVAGMIAGSTGIAVDATSSSAHPAAPAALSPTQQCRDAEAAGPSDPLYWWCMVEAGELINGRGSRQFRQDCCQAAGQCLSHADNSGMTVSAQIATDGPGSSGVLPCGLLPTAEFAR